MSLNYYLHERGKNGEAVETHIGLSVMKQYFLLHVMPELGISTLEDWESKWSQLDVQILDECERLVTPEQMRGVITERDPGWKSTFSKNLDWTPGEGTFVYVTNDFC